MGLNPQNVRWEEAPPPTPEPSWRDTLPPEIKDDPVFTKYENQNDANKALVGAQKFLGRETLPVPKDDNDAEAYSVIAKRLGLPKDENGYTIPTDLEIPKELPLDEGRMNDFKKTAHSLGILPKQFEGLYKWHMNDMINLHKQHNEGLENGVKETETGLRKEWGAAYQQNIALAEKVINQFSDEAGIKYLKDRGLNNDLNVIKILANIGKVMGDDVLIGKPAGMAQSPDEAQAELNAMQADTKGPLHNADHPQHKEFVDKRDRLTKLITG